MKIILKDIDVQDYAAAINVINTWKQWYNSPEWDKKKVTFDKKFNVHETQTGTIVVSKK